MNVLFIHFVSCSRKTQAATAEPSKTMNGIKAVVKKTTSGNYCDTYTHYLTVLHDKCYTN